MRVTIKDIAQAVGLSPATVSLVLNDRPSRISQKARERILAAAEEMGYRPNYAAVSLKTSRSYTLGLIINDICNDYYANYAKGMEDYCAENGRSLIICSTNGNPKRERHHIETLNSKSIDGISVITTPSAQDKHSFASNKDLILSMKIPLVQMDLTDYRKPGSAVICNHEKGGYMGTRHLLSLGHRRIAFITGSSSLEGSNSRLNGCRKAFADNKIPWDDSMVYEGDYSYEAGLNGVDYFSDKSFTAVFAFNDLMACGVYNGLSKYNLRIPEDVSIIGYDDQFIAGILNPPLTTVRQPVYEMGREAARILINASEHEDAEPVITQFDLQLIVRKSTARI